MAYSLLGLFDINMPLIYGEGHNAFFRLQCEIIRSSFDESIFAWRDSGLNRSGLLARDPRAFQDSYDVVPLSGKDYYRPPYYMTNKGIAIELRVRHQARDLERLDGHFTTILACARASNDRAPLILSLDTSDRGVQVSRTNCHVLEFDDDYFYPRNGSLQKSKIRTFHVRNAYSEGFFLTGPAPTSARLKLKTKWLPARVKLTEAASDAFNLAQDITTPSLSSTASVKNEPFTRHPHAGSWNRRMLFLGSGWYGFVLSWQEDEAYASPMELYCPIDRLQLTASESISLVLSRAETQRVTLGPSGNFTYPFNQKFLWITTRMARSHGYERQVVEIDITAIDRWNICHLTEATTAATAGECSGSYHFQNLPPLAAP